MNHYGHSHKINYDCFNLSDEVATVGYIAISSAGVSLVRTGSVGDQIASSAQSSVGRTDHLEKIELQDFNTTKILYIISPKWNFDKNQLIRIHVHNTIILTWVC